MSLHSWATAVTPSRLCDAWKERLWIYFVCLECERAGTPSEMASRISDLEGKFCGWFLWEFVGLWGCQIYCGYLAQLVSCLTETGEGFGVLGEGMEVVAQRPNRRLRHHRSEVPDHEPNGSMVRLVSYLLF